jgi:hypothetical protein
MGLVFFVVFCLISVGLPLAIAVLSIRNSRRIRSDIPSRIPWFVCLTFATITFMVFIAALCDIVSFLTRSLPTQAWVVEVKESTSRIGDIQKTIVYEYRDHSGALRRDSSAFQDGSHEQIGSIIPIRHLADQPSSSRIDRFLPRWFVTLLFGLATVYLIAIAFGIRWFNNKRIPKMQRLKAQTTSS